MVTETYRVQSVVPRRDRIIVTLLPSQDGNSDANRFYDRQPQILNLPLSERIFFQTHIGSNISMSATFEASPIETPE